MKESFTQSAYWMASGTVIGAGISTAIGNVGVVGSFGGMSFGVGAVASMGAVVGLAGYGALSALATEDAIALGAIGMGGLGGVCISTAVGGMGVSLGGTAFGIGMGTMAVTGGVLGLAAYGAYKILTTTNRQTKFYKNLLALEQITREYEQERFWTFLEVDTDLALFRTEVQEIEPVSENIVVSCKIAPQTPQKRDLFTNAFSLEEKFRELELEEELQFLKANLK